ncbi:MAG TPA: hypothetical protein VFL86_17625 [Burkholderiaceae bacterium]|nr:hypothetical protein [Burkholderiaceae bacterium]
MGHVHDLCRCTALYGTRAVIDNKGAARQTVRDITSVTFCAGQKPQGFEAGFRQSC